MRVSSILVPLTIFLTGTLAMPSMDIDLDPANPDGGAIITIPDGDIAARELSPTVAGSPLAAREASAATGEEDLEKRACPSSKKISYQGGGCSAVWAGHCYDRCSSRSKGKGCCSGTVSSSIVGNGCVWGWSTCECTCMKG